MKNQYRAIGRLVKGSTRIGLVFEMTDRAGKTKRYELSNAQIINKMNNGEIFDITVDKRGFRFIDKQKRISDLPIMKYENKSVSLLRPIKHNIIVREFTGDALKKLAINFGANKYKCRDFVSAINEYCNASDPRVLSICGLRGTGKTTGILQAIYKMNISDKSVYISIDEESDMNCLDLRNLIVSKYKNKKYIFIDEITRVKDMINNSGFLCDLLCGCGHKVIISGTDSLGLVKSEGAGLYHRVINLNVTQITFAEAIRTMNQSLLDYIQLGGLYEASKIKDIDGVRQYIDTAVVDNIMNTLTKNKGVTSLLGIDGINNRSKLRTLVFRIIYAVIYCNLTNSRTTSVRQLINLFDYKSSTSYDAKALNSLVCRQMLVDEEVSFTQVEIEALMITLKELGLVVKIHNLFDTEEFSCYITNPSIVNQLVGSIITELNKTKLPKVKNATLRSLNGHVYESIIVTHTFKAANKFGNNLYYYRDKNNREIDLIIEKYKPSLFENLYLYYEIKMTNDYDTAVAKSKWISDPDVTKFIDDRGIIVGKGIIYTGKNDKFSGFKDENTYPPKGMTVEQIENQNMGVELISAYDYLLHTIDKVYILETYEVD